MPSPTHGVHSEVGKLNKVLVCRPGLSHERLTPSNNDDLLFDDVLWVESAQRDHQDFVDNLRSRGVEVVELHELLTETLAVPGARQWLLDRKLTDNDVGMGLVDDTRAFLDTLEHPALTEYLIGGLSTRELPEEFRTGHLALARCSEGLSEYLMPPLPNTIYTRDTTCWIYGGLTLNPLYWPARHDETLLMKAIYAFHPDFTGSTIWWGDPEQDVGAVHLRGRGCDADRQWGGPGRDERAHLATGDHPGRRQAVRGGGSDQGRRRCDAEAARRHAPGHRLHVRRP